MDRSQASALAQKGRKFSGARHKSIKTQKRLNHMFSAESLLSLRWQWHSFLVDTVQSSKLLLLLTCRSSNLERWQWLAEISADTKPIWSFSSHRPILSLVQKCRSVSKYSKSQRCGTGGRASSWKTGWKSKPSFRNKYSSQFHDGAQTRPYDTAGKDQCLMNQPRTSTDTKLTQSRRKAESRTAWKHQNSKTFESRVFCWISSKLKMTVTQLLGGHRSKFKTSAAAYL